MWVIWYLPFYLKYNFTYAAKCCVSLSSASSNKQRKQKNSLAFNILGAMLCLSTSRPFTCSSSLTTHIYLVTPVRPSSRPPVIPSARHPVRPSSLPPVIPSARHPVRPSVFPHDSEQLSIDAFLWNFILRTPMKICWETSDLFQIGKKCRARYTKT
jgi:hypothetical protein